MNLTKIVSTDNLRPTMCCAIIMNGYIYATNGYILIKVKISDFFPLSDQGNKVLDIELIKAISKAEESDVYFHEDHVKIKTRLYPYSGSIDPVTRKMTMSKYSISRNADGCSYPDIESVINKKGSPLELYRVGLDSELLSCLSRGFCGTTNKRIVLNFKGENKDGIIVTPREGEGDQFGLIMPVRLED